MDADVYKLGLRLVATERWEWRPGMRAVHPDGSSHRRVEDGAPEGDGFVPDMSDDVTVGAVFFLAKDVLYSMCRPEDWEDLNIDLHIRSPVHNGRGNPRHSLGYVVIGGEHILEGPPYGLSWEWCSESHAPEGVVEALEMVCDSADPIKILPWEELDRMGVDGVGSRRAG